MNERIKQLAYEAGQGGHSWYNDPNCIQAFAELIVQECLMKANGAKIRGESIDTLIRNIKEDFGIEE